LEDELDAEVMRHDGEDREAESQTQILKGAAEQEEESEAEEDEELPRCLSGGDKRKVKTLGTPVSPAFSEPCVWLELVQKC